MLDDTGSQTPRVLIAGDAASALLFMSSTASVAGYSVACADSCARIADYFTPGSERVDLLVLDARRRGSVAACVLIALRAAGNRLPIVVVAGADPTFASDLLRLGATSVLESPWRPRQLRRALASLAPVEHVTTRPPMTALAGGASATGASPPVVTEDRGIHLRTGTAG
jgi:CheY-like chemotaxis protein